METYLASALIVLFASTLQAATGFGFSILAVPLLLLVHEPLPAIQINLVLSIVMSLIMVPRLREDIDKPLLGRLVKGSVLGAPIGAAALYYLDVVVLKTATGLTIIALTLLLLVQFRVRRTPWRDYGCGSLAGVFTAALGLAGIPLLLYFAGTDAPKAAVRSTVLAFFLFVYTLTLGIQLMTGSTAGAIWLTSAALIPITWLGVRAGQMLFLRISQRAFQLLMYAVLATTGGYLLWSSLPTP